MPHQQSQIELARCTAEPEAEEFSTACSCCGRSILWGHGWLTIDGRSLAAYWYSWSTGHPGGFVLKLALFDEHERLIPGVIAFGASIDHESIRYTILEPTEATWAGIELSRFGSPVSRSQAMSNKGYLFSIVDAIAAKEKRLSSRILGSEA